MIGSRMYELVTLGEAGVIGEIIRLEGERAAIQAYEETAGLKPGEKVLGTGRPLSVELGPGLIGQIYDGIQRPLPTLRDLVGSNIRRGVIPPALDRNKKWLFRPAVKTKTEVTGGDIIGTVQETSLVEHRILVPPWIKKGIIERIVSEDKYTVTDVVAKVKTEEGVEDLNLMHTWHVREPRPYKFMLPPDVPLMTGQRIIDAFFPLAKGGTATIPGGFGTGKTVMLQTLAQWANADIVILVGCGERGNEMADVLERFPKLMDYRSGQPLMSRTIVVANTSDMPIAAREASIYTAASIAEYCRDMGYDVALMADSTSRWAEALREISGRLEEMPGEEGYPAYLPSRLAEFYARAGHAQVLGSGERFGSVTAIGAVSPPGGDFSEPVTGGTLRITKVFWALDFTLAHRRHYPAINWFMSYSEYVDTLESWYEEVGQDWAKLRKEALSLLKEEEELREIASLVGAEILGDKQRCVFEAAKMCKEYFLLQSALHPIDMNCPISKTYRMLRLILKFYEKAKQAVEGGVSLVQVLSLDVKEDLARMKIIRPEEFDEASARIERKLSEQFDQLFKGATGGMTI
ncbi:V-type ATP synthase subunit A [Candidatus Bathyarchaeota archaeon RBG_13_46_16b]|nr:MAG: V-type ATP synthase subunit A [Candidatus Bathyarchaeota archaeon RBG_13_46_16b]